MRSILLSILIILCIVFTHGPTIAASPLQIQAKQYYDRHEFTTAIQLWQQALELAKPPEQKIAIHQALALSCQDLGQWKQAQSHLSSSQALLDQNPNRFLQAKTLNIQATLWQNLGKYQDAIAIWQQSEQQYRQLKDPYGIALSQLNQAQSLQTLGRHQQAKVLLEKIDAAQNSALEGTLRLRLGITLQALGDFDIAKPYLEKGLPIAQNLPNLQAQILGELANFDERNGELQTALNRYIQAYRLATSPQDRVQCLVHQFHLLLKTQRLTIAQQLLTDLQTLLEKAPNSRWSIDAAIHLADRALTWNLKSPSIKPLLRSRRISSGETRRSASKYCCPGRNWSLLRASRQSRPSPKVHPPCPPTG
ncbi:MAG: tetratricopeptide repeat protein [Alkalinema sp. RU_4_3]|nr:tetratricopeptide repeat protein [Alkalinema sp. RU_4_3]